MQQNHIFSKMPSLTDELQKQFEKDVEQNQRLKADRLRAIILQETFDKISLENL